MKNNSTLSTLRFVQKLTKAGFFSKNDFKDFGQKEFRSLVKKNLDVPVSSLNL
ncbi:MAG TPA: hypothetical protein VK338_01265 [Candidatus Nitrosocosmicus sp.]|nr:hypothetical protein [Candidatus Nitrosocosmicus sp.]